MFLLSLMYITLIKNNTKRDPYIDLRTQLFCHVPVLLRPMFHIPEPVPERPLNDVTLL